MKRKRRALDGVRALALSTVSGVALAGVMPLHELAWQTIMLKAGLRLGFITSAGAGGLH